MAGKQQADERDAPQGDGYLEPEEAGQFAGLVYPAREDHPDAEDAAGDSDDVNDDSGDVENDAPPFAAPFAPVPRLNRVRSTPTPPADEDE
jgi:hypothetical protein